MGLDIEKNLGKVLENVEKKLADKKYETAGSLIKTELAEIREAAQKFDSAVKGIEDKHTKEIEVKDTEIKKVNDENIDLIKSNNQWYEKFGSRILGSDDDPDTRKKSIPSDDGLISNEEFGKGWCKK